MFRPFVFLSTASLALICAIGMPGQLHAQINVVNVLPSPSWAGVPPGPGLTGPWLNPRFSMLTPGFDPRFFDPRFSMATPGFDRRHFSHHFGPGFRGAFMPPGKPFPGPGPTWPRTGR